MKLTIWSLSHLLFIVNFFSGLFWKDYSNTLIYQFTFIISGLLIALGLLTKPRRKIFKIIIKIKNVLKLKKGIKI